MSNVVKLATSFTGTDQPAVVGKILEEQFTDSSGNLSVRYVRAFKASTTVTAGQVVGAANAAAVPAMHTTGVCVPSVASANIDKQFLYGVSLSAVAAGSWGFAVCRGYVQSVSSNGLEIGDLIITSGATAGMVIQYDAIAAGKTNTVLGITLTDTAANVADCYVDFLG